MAKEDSKLKSTFIARRSSDIDNADEQTNFHLLAEAIPHLVFTIKADGSIDYLNKRWFEYTGMPFTKNYQTDKLLQHIHPLDHDEVLQNWIEAFKNETFFEHDFRIRSGSGDYHWFLVKVTPAKDSSGQVIRWFGTGTDITEHREGIRALQHLAAIVESTDDAIVGIDLNSGITSWNSGAEKMFGLTADEVLGKHISLMVPPDRIEELNEIMEVIRIGEPVDHFHTRRLTKNGHEIDVSARP